MFQGIAGLKAEAQAAAVVTIGRKGDRGAPIERDRFYIMDPEAGKRDYAKSGGGTYEALARELHPRFAAWNRAAAEGARECRTIAGNLAFASLPANFAYHLRCQQPAPKTAAPTPPGGGVWDTPPNGRPWCTGDGVRAERFAGVKDGAAVYQDIACPHDLCAFRAKVGGNVACKPWGRLFFYLRWKESSGLPAVLTKFTTQSWNSIKAILGMIEAVQQTAAGAGIPNVNLVGLPFTLTVTTKTDRLKKAAFPVVKASVDGDLLEFLRSRQLMALEAGGTGFRALPPGPAPIEMSPHVIDLDTAEITPGPGIPVSSAPVRVDLRERAWSLAEELAPSIVSAACMRVAGVSDVGEVPDAKLGELIAAIE